ncbi:MAG TPA: hypothetical protein VF174_15685 [Micromonosporaceae bacterium]
MTWFRVDDRFHSHPKVLATEPAALGLWVVAGAWSSANLLDGFVPDQALPRLLPGSEMLAEKLVTAGLWRRIRGGYQFHDWTDYNPTAEQVRALQKQRAEAGRKGGLSKGSKPLASAQANGKQPPDVRLNPRPDPPPSTKGGRGKRGSASPEPAAPPELPPPHPFAEDANGNCKRCPLPRINRIHPAA